MNFTKDKVTDLLAQIKIAKVLSFFKNENSDHLLVVKILTTDGEKQIVTAADNFKEGDLVPYLAVGFTVPGFLFSKGESFVLEARKLRGYMSEGMILAEDEIGLSDDHGGIVIYNVEDALVGKSIIEVLSAEQIALIEKRAGVVEMTAELQERISLIMSIADNGGEIIGGDELPAILTSGEDLFTYDGFEPSGQMHIAQGLIRAINTNKMIKAGFTFKMLVADWFGYLNNKMGGDLNKIKKVGQYFIEIWKATGMDIDHTEFLWTSDFVGQKEYWETVMKVSKATTLKRMLRTTEIMGRSESDDLSAAQMLYPAMQITDIFKVMKCQVTQLGLDQKKVNVLAREVGPELGFWKPVIVSQGMLQGLQTPVSQIKKINVTFDKDHFSYEDERYVINQIQMGSGRTGENDKSVDFEVNLEINDKYTESKNTFRLKHNSDYSRPISGLTINNLEVSAEGHAVVLIAEYDERHPKDKAISMKMSKSKPETAIFMTDNPEDIERKIKAAYCPPLILEDNPILAYVKQIIFEAHYLKGFENLLENGFVIGREEKNGGNLVLQSYVDLENAYSKGEIHPWDLKIAVIKYLNLLLEPVRNHFEKDLKAKAILEDVKSYQVTR